MTIFTFVGDDYKTKKMPAYWLFDEDGCHLILGEGMMKQILNLKKLPDSGTKKSSFWDKIPEGLTMHEYACIVKADQI